MHAVTFFLAEMRGRWETPLSAFERYYTEFFRFLSRKLRDKHLAEELTQETFSRALASPEAVSSHRGLLYHIARNLLVDRYRHQQHPASGQEMATDELLAPGAEQPDSVLEKQQYIDRIVATIEELPPRCREAFILHRIDGLSQSESLQEWVFQPTWWKNISFAPCWRAVHAATPGALNRRQGTHNDPPGR